MSGHCSSATLLAYTPRRVTMMVTLERYMFTLIARRPLGLQDTHDGPGVAPGWTARAGAAGYVATPELPRAGQRELVPQGTWRPQSCPGLGSGSWCHRTRGDPKAAPGWAAGAGAAGHVAAPELPRAVWFMLRL
jgi:hypothetical protein